MNEEIQKILKMSKEGTLSDEQAAELISALAEKESKLSREWGQAGDTGIGDAISTVIGKTIDGAIGLSGMSGTSMSHVEGFLPSDLQANSFHMSKVEGPNEGQYVFTDNKIRMSHLSELDFGRSEITGNQIDASKLEGVSITESKFSDSQIQASAVEKLTVSQSQVSNSKILSSKWLRVTIEGESTLEGVKFNACSVKGMKISDDSHWRRSVLSGVAIADLTSEKSSISHLEADHAHLAQTRVIDSTLNGIVLRGMHISKTTLTGCKMNDVLFSGGGEKWLWKQWKKRGLQEVVFDSCKLDKVLISNCRWSGVTLRNVTLSDFKIQDVQLSGLTLDGNEAFLKALEEGKIR